MLRLKIILFGLLIVYREIDLSGTAGMPDKNKAAAVGQDGVAAGREIDPEVLPVDNLLLFYNLPERLGNSVPEKFALNVFLNHGLCAQSL